MNENEPYLQLQMVWPEHLFSAPPTVHLPPGYTLRTYQRGDEPGFCRVMDLAGWPGWDDEKLRPWIARIPPESWFMILHDATNTIVATAMGLHDHSDDHPFGGELGWVAADPAHTGQGLGSAVCAAVTARLIGAGYGNIHLYTEHWRLAALKLYLKLGYVPFLYTPEMSERWRVVCAELGWSFTLEVWRLRQLGNMPSLQLCGRFCCNNFTSVLTTVLNVASFKIATRLTIKLSLAVNSLSGRAKLIASNLPRCKSVLVI